jgi:hypothetical protein
MTYCFIIPNVRSNHLLALHAEHESSYNCSGVTGGHVILMCNYSSTRSAEILISPWAFYFQSGLYQNRKAPFYKGCINFYVIMWSSQARALPKLCLH